MILDSALRVIRERGLARATTKEIAKGANLSEAALYKHFTDKAEIFLSVLQERSPGFRPLQQALAVQPGSATVTGNLTAIAAAAAAFYTENFPLNEAVATYLRAERDLGRLRTDADVDTAADLLLGACFQQAFLTHFHGSRPDPQRYANLLHSILA